MYKRHWIDRTVTCHPDRPYCAKGLCKPCYDADYRKKNRSRLSQYQKEQYAENKAQLARYHRVDVKQQREQAKLDALARFGLGGCVQCCWPGCTVTDPDMLTLDHIDNDGRARRKLGEGRGNGLYRRVKYGHITGLQTLCANHNLKKEILRRRAS